MNLGRFRKILKSKRISESPIIHRLLGGAAWTLAGNLASRLASVCAFIALARLLGKEQLGELGIIQSTLLTLQTLGGLGLGWAITRYIAKYKVTDVERIGCAIYFAQIAVLVCSCFLALMLTLFSSIISLSIFNNSHLSILLKISSIWIILNSVAGLKAGILMGMGEFRSLAKFNLLSGFSTFALMVGAGWKYGLIGVVLAMVLTQAIDCLILSRIEHRVLIEQKIKVNSLGDWWSERQMFWNFGLPSVFGGFLLQGSVWAASVMLVNQPSGYSEMGYYNAANQWFSALMFLPAILGQSSVPLIMECLALRKFDDVANIFRKSLALNIVFVFIFVIAGSLISPWLMALYGPGFSTKWLTLVLLLFAAGAAAVQLPAAQIISTSGRMWLAQTIQAAFSITLLISSALFAKWGSEGLALSRLLGYMAYAAIAFFIADKLIRKLKEDSIEIKESKI